MNIYCKDRTRFRPYLYSNKRKVNDNVFEYECDINNIEKIEYQVKGINVIQNNDIQCIKWECEGFNNCTPIITQNGLLTLMKNNSSNYDYYTGTVKVMNEYGSYQINLLFYNNIKLPVLLSYDNELLNSYYYYELTGKNNNSDDIYLIDKYNLKIDDGSSVEQNTISDINSHIPIYGSIAILKSIKFENLYNFETNSYNGDLILTNKSYKFGLTNSKNSYFIISNINNENYKQYTIQVHYNKNDYDEIIDKYTEEENLPYIDIYAQIIKNNLVYNTSNIIRKYIGIKFCSLPKLNDNNCDSKETINNKEYCYIYIADSTIETISYIIMGDNIDINENIEYVNWDIKGFGYINENDENNEDDDEEQTGITINKNSNNEWQLSFDKIENVYDYYGTITVITNFGTSSINLHIYAQQHFAPILNSNIIYDDESHAPLYTFTTNNEEMITYQMTGENIVIDNNKHISSVTWSCEGFNDNAVINNNGLLTVTKIDSTINNYEGTVTCTNNFDTNSTTIHFYNPFTNVYPLKLSFDEEIGIFDQEKEIIKEINDENDNFIDSGNIYYYLELDDGNSSSKLSLDDLNGLIEDINEDDTTSYNCESKIYIEWNNILESTTNSYSGNICLNDIKDLYFKFSDIFDTNNSYFKISYNENKFNCIDYTFNYNKNDFNYIINNYNQSSDLPYIFIYNRVSKCGYFYNNSTKLKLTFGFMLNEKPQLLINNTKKISNGEIYDYVLYENDVDNIEYIINGKYIIIDNLINEVNWNVTGFNNASYNIYKNKLNQYILSIDKIDDKYIYQGILTVTTNMGTANINLYLEVKKGLMPILNSNIEYIDDNTISYLYSTNTNNRITYQLTGENIKKNNNEYIEYVNWYCDGFENSAQISSSGLLTINKIENINSYSGTVTCTNNFGSDTVEIIFEDPFNEVNPINLYWENDNNENITEKTYTQFINNNTESTQFSNSFQNYYYIYNNRINEKLTSSSQLYDILPEASINKSGSVVIKTYLKWENLQEIYTTDTSDNEVLISVNDLSKYRFPITTTHKTYFEIYKNDSNTIIARITYNKDDYDELALYTNDENYIAPCIYIFNKIYKCGYYYNTTSLLKLNIKLNINNPPELYMNGLSNKMISE